MKNRDARPAVTPLAVSLLIASLGLVSGPSAVVLAQDAPVDAPSEGTPVALESLIVAAHENHADLRAARAAISLARSQADEARARLLPSFTATGTYTRNEIEVVFRTQAADGSVISRTITPYDQLDARFAVLVPILDASSWASFLSAEASGDAAADRAASAQDDVDVIVTQLYYQLVGARSLIEVAERSRLVAEQALTFTRARHEVGVATASELARAEAEVLRAEQTRQEAELAVTLAERNLANLTGTELHGRALPAIEVDERELGGSLEDHLDHLDETPAVRAARGDVLAAERGVHAGWLAFVPTVSGTASERVTNAVGFGPNSSWSVALTATWTLDFLRPAQVGTREATLAAARARLERAEQQARLQIEDAWHRSRALAARARTTAAVLDASRRAAEDARARYEVGVASQLELQQAERDLFGAEISRVQALADLAVARETLRIRTR
ncbi:MAG: TolC family protein [Sandaracinus sp.]